MSQGDSRNNVHLGPNLPNNHKIAKSSKEALDTSKNNFISNVRSFFQVMKSTLPLKFVKVNQGVPHNLMCFLHMPLKGIKDQVILLAPDNPHETTPLEKPNMTEEFH